MELSWENLDRLMRRIPDVLLFAIGLGIVAGLTAFKLTLGQRIPLVDFLLVPVVWVGWFARARWYGYLLGLIAAAVSGAAAMGGVTQASLGEASASACARLALYVVVLGLLGMMRRERTGHQRAAAVDALTGTANVRSFRTLMEAEVLRSQRYGRPLSLAYIDLDDFKAINDEFGHAEGDHVLKQVGHVLRAVVRAVDSPARIGGDEFAVLMPETDGESAIALIERVRRELDRVMVGGRQRLRVSVGVATFDRPPGSADELAAAADELMYRAKDQGKDGIERAERAGSYGGARFDKAAVQAETRPKQAPTGR